MAALLATSNQALRCMEVKQTAERAVINVTVGTAKL